MKRYRERKAPNSPDGSRLARVKQNTHRTTKHEQKSLDGSMVACRVHWAVFALWNMLLGTAPHVVSTQMNITEFEVEYGIRHSCGILFTRGFGSMIECAAECGKKHFCHGFNFGGSGQCELLSATATGRTNAAGWIHGYFPIGKYRTKEEGWWFGSNICLSCGNICYSILWFLPQNHN